MNETLKLRKDVGGKCNHIIGMALSTITLFIQASFSLPSVNRNRGNITLSPAPLSFSVFHAEKQKCLGNNVMCMTLQVDVWWMYNPHTWIIAVLTTATESIIDSKGALDMTTLT